MTCTQSIAMLPASEERANRSGLIGITFLLRQAAKSLARELGYSGLFSFLSLGEGVILVVVMVQINNPVVSCSNLYIHDS